MFEIAEGQRSASELLCGTSAVRPPASAPTRERSQKDPMVESLAELSGVTERSERRGPERVPGTIRTYRSVFSFRTSQVTPVEALPKKGQTPSRESRKAEFAF